MRTLTIFRALVLAAAVSAPLAQAALAGQVEQQALANQGATATFSYGGAYNNDTLMSPAVGD